jgi:glycosyltransferase involved in cell wall biosynthesis
MKILFVIPTLQNDGAERAMSSITTHLPESVEADILVNSISENDYPTKANVITLGMKSNVNKGNIYQFVAMNKRILKLYSLKKNNKYDACISFLDSANICNILVRDKKCKTILSVRNNIAENKSFTYRYIVNPLARILYNKADVVAAVSEGVRIKLIENFNIHPSHVKTITNGYCKEDIRIQAMAETDIDIKEIVRRFVYVAIGRYSFQKAQWHLIRAFRKVVDECGNNVHLVIIGQGTYESYLKEVIHENNLETNVTLLPYQKNPFAILNKCDVFVMPSMFEGYCNALCEALICGLPCIATDFQSSAREIIAPGTPINYQIKMGIEYAEYGIITPVCSGTKYKGNEPLENAEQDLADAMLALYKDKEIFNNYKLKANIRANQFDINKKVQEWIELV